MSKFNLHQVITDTIIERINETGELPWSKPWASFDHQSIRQPYHGINALLLMIVADKYSYKSNLWLTFKDVQKMGGQIVKGSKSAMVTYWTKYDKAGEDGENKEYFVMRYYRVFNADCVTGVDLSKYQKQARNISDTEATETAQSLVDGYFKREGIKFTNSGNRAYYAPGLDAVNLPPREHFDDDGHYYSTLFHEATHSTGAATRLKRFDPVGAHYFGNESYSKEELVAELGAAFLASETGIENTNTKDQNAAYIKGWLKALKNDCKMIVQASSKASKAVKFIEGEI